MKTNFLFIALLLIGTCAMADGTPTQPDPGPAVKKFKCFTEGSMDQIENDMNQHCDRTKPFSTSNSSTDYSGTYTACCIQK
jgi:hypothetical protein